MCTEETLNNFEASHITAKVRSTDVKKALKAGYGVSDGFLDKAVLGIPDLNRDMAELPGLSSPT